MSEGNFRVAILASGDRESGGGGSTADKFTRDALEGKVNLEIGVVICNNPEGTVAVYDRFRVINDEYGLKGDDRIDVVTINSTTHPEGRQRRGQTLGESAAICRLLEQRGIGFVAMLGYMKILTGEFVEEWGWKPQYGAVDPTHNGKYNPLARIFNNHPSILPLTADTHGLGAHALAVELYQKGRIKHTAMTFHLGAAGVDTGPVIYEEPVEIYKQDDAVSLSDRVQVIEKALTAPVLERHLILRREQLRGDS